MVSISTPFPLFFSCCCRCCSLSLLFCGVGGGSSSLVSLLSSYHLAARSAQVFFAFRNVDLTTKVNATLFVVFVAGGWWLFFSLCVCMKRLFLALQHKQTPTQMHAHTHTNTHTHMNPCCSFGLLSSPSFPVTVDLWRSDSSACVCVRVCVCVWVYGSRSFPFLFFISRLDGASGGIVLEHNKTRSFCWRLHIPAHMTEEQCSSLLSCVFLPLSASVNKRVCVCVSCEECEPATEKHNKRGERWLRFKNACRISPT